MSESCGCRVSPQRDRQDGAAGRHQSGQWPLAVGRGCGGGLAWERACCCDCCWLRGAAVEGHGGGPFPSPSQRRGTALLAAERAVLGRWRGRRFALKTSEGSCSVTPSTRLGRRPSGPTPAKAGAACLTSTGVKWDAGADGKKAVFKAKHLRSQ